MPRPQATLELEVDDVAAELTAQGHALIHGPRTEPWGQEIARLIGLAHTPSLHRSPADVPAA